MPKIKTHHQLFIRPNLTAAEAKLFKKACKEVGETMTSVYRRLALKIGAGGDRELLDRVRS